MRSLSESLEQYAERHAVKLRDARLHWRQDGLIALGSDPFRAVADGPRIAPGLAVPVFGLLPADVIEVEP